MDAVQRLETMLAAGTDNALLRFGLGNAYLARREFAIAVQHLRSAIEQDPHYSAAWKLLGKALTETGDASQAIAAYERGIAVAQAKGDLQAAKEMGVFLKRLQKSFPAQS